MKRNFKNILSILLRKKQQLSQKQAKAHGFITWLMFANPGMLDNGNIYCFEYAIEHLPSNSPIVEIGSFCGLSTNLISFYLRKNNKSNKLITCDKWIFETADLNSTIGQSEISQTNYREFVKDSFMEQVKNGTPTID